MLKWSANRTKDPNSSPKFSNRRSNLLLSPSLRTPTPYHHNHHHYRHSSLKRKRLSSFRRKSYGCENTSIDNLELELDINPNQYHSTPIKDDTSSHHNLKSENSPFRDLSNLTIINDVTRRKQRKIERKTPVKVKKKKKSRSDASNYCNSYFNAFDKVDYQKDAMIMKAPICCCKIENFNNNINNNCTLPKIVQNTFQSDENPSINEVDLKLVRNSSLKNQKLTPLARKFCDIRFKNTSLDKNIQDNSSFINDMSLDKIVEVLLENLSKSEQFSMDSNKKNEMENESTSDSYKKKEDEFIKDFRNELSKQNTTPIKEFNENCVDVDVEAKKRQSSSNLDDYMVQKKPRFNTEFPFKRQKPIRRKNTKNLSNKPQQKQQQQQTTHPNKDILESVTTPKAIWSTKKTIIQVASPSATDDDSFLMTTDGLYLENTPMRGCYLENKHINGDTLDGKNQKSSAITNVSTSKKCLFSKSSNSTINNNNNNNNTLSNSSFADSISKCTFMDTKGSMDLKIFISGYFICISVIKCQDLYRLNGESINPYVKIAISDDQIEDRTDNEKPRNLTLQRTPVHSDTSNPIFNHIFRFSMVLIDDRKRIHLEVWHREKNSKHSEFLGCMSFRVKDVISTAIKGSFKLLSHSEGRLGNCLTNTDFPNNETQVTVKHQIVNMDDKNHQKHNFIGLNSETSNSDATENELKSRTTSKTTLTEQQKHADENIFLKYLELDPPDVCPGPESSSAPQPTSILRKTASNKFGGRTPFTQTKKLVRSSNSSFGFSVVWTHPPRIEKVEKGLPADRAGIMQGDYIVFVDKHNVVMMPEIDILNLIRSYGSQLTLEIFRRHSPSNGSLIQKSTTPSSIRTNNSNVVHLSGITTATSNNMVQRRPSTVCSTNTASVDYRRRKLNLPQVTFSLEKSTNPEENRKHLLYQLIEQEQRYAATLQFAIARFVSSLAERRDLITPLEHQTLFQNSEMLLRITEDILDNLLNEDGSVSINSLLQIYLCKLHEITSAYKKYLTGLKKADCILANKMRNSNSDFVRFVQIPAIPKRKPDLTAFIHKPLQHFRELLKNMMAIQTNTEPKHDEFPVINQIVNDLQITYREIIAEQGLMEPCGEGRPLLTVQDLENRLVFTKCKPFILSKSGRQWIFGGDLSKIEGRNVRQCWALLFNDILLFATISRDRVLFISEDPIPLVHIKDMYFNIRKKDTEFRICINPDKEANSPTVHCGPDLSRTPIKSLRKKTIILRAPTTELKAVWQNLLQRQIFRLNCGMENSSPSSPMDYPEIAITSSVGTLQSIETSSLPRQSQNLIAPSDNHNPNQINNTNNEDSIKTLECLIAHKCKQVEKNSYNGKCNAIHLEQWMKGQLDDGDVESPISEHFEEEWTEEMLRKRSEELQLIDQRVSISVQLESKMESKCNETVLISKEELRVEKEDSDRQDEKGEEGSVSRSSSTESQITVCSSPTAQENVQLCRQCHKNCLSNIMAHSKLNHINHFRDCNSNESMRNYVPLEKINPENSSKQDPFGTCIQTSRASIDFDKLPLNRKNSLQKNHIFSDVIEYNSLGNVSLSPDDYDQLDDLPYHSLSSSYRTLKRFGTVPSLECLDSDECDCIRNHTSSKDSELDDDCDDDEDDEDYDYRSKNNKAGIDNEAFNHSSIVSWTAKAGNYVFEKMTLFEKFGEDCRKSGGFFERYLKTLQNHISVEDTKEEETSGATSGEEIWGTPTSGGESEALHSPLSSNFEGKLSPCDDSVSSESLDDTEFMMDELLMAPPISGAALRGLLPRSTLEPLIEEDCSETNSFSSSSAGVETPTSGLSEQGIEIGNVADRYCRDAVDPKQKLPIYHQQKHNQQQPESNSNNSNISGGSSSTSTSNGIMDETLFKEEHLKQLCLIPTLVNTKMENINIMEKVQMDYEDEKGYYEEADNLQTTTMIPTTSTNICQPINMPRSESYRKVVEAAENQIFENKQTVVMTTTTTVENPIMIFNSFRPVHHLINSDGDSSSCSNSNNLIDGELKTRSKIFNFFNVRWKERRISDKFSATRHSIKLYGKDSNFSDDTSPLCPQRTDSPKKLKDKEADRRFWKQLSKKRTLEKDNSIT